MQPQQLLKSRKLNLTMATDKNWNKRYGNKILDQKRKRASEKVYKEVRIHHQGTNKTPQNSTQNAHTKKHASKPIASNLHGHKMLCSVLKLESANI